jgi:hypothetical protein
VKTSEASDEASETNEASPLTADELRMVQHALGEGGTDWLSLASMLVSSVLLVGSCLRAMRGVVDLAFLIIGLAILAYWCVLVWQAVERWRSRARALEVVRRWRSRTEE